MPRKAVLEGGKRDEIIYAAMELFFEKGFEATSVRMILERVGGEVGMFYHYFKSKEELFQVVVERFFEDYQKRFLQLAQACNSRDEFMQRLLSNYEESMLQFQSLSENLHWTIQYAMAAKTIEELKPIVMQLLIRWGYREDIPADMLAGQLLYGISATLHSPDYVRMTLDEKKKMLELLINRFLPSTQEGKGIEV